MTFKVKFPCPKSSNCLPPAWKLDNLYHHRGDLQRQELYNWTIVYKCSFFTQFWIRTVIYDVRNKVINVLELVLMSHPLYLHLINKRHGSQTLQQIIWPWNHTFHKNFHFYEFVANVLRDNIYIYRHTYFWPPWKLLEAKHHTATAHFGT